MCQSVKLVPGFGFRGHEGNPEHEGPKTEPSQNPAGKQDSQYTQNPVRNLKDGNKLMISQVKSRVEQDRDLGDESRWSIQNDLNHLMISIMTYLGWVRLAKGKRAGTNVAHGRRGALFLYFHFIFDIHYLYLQRKQNCF